MMGRSPRSMPSTDAWRRTASTSPSRVRSTTCRRRSSAAAVRIRSSVPSGRTMWRRSARARSIRSYSNISGVTRSDRVISMWRSRASVSMCSSNSPSAVAILRCDPAPITGLTALMVRAVS